MDRERLTWDDRKQIHERRKAEARMRRRTRSKRASYEAQFKGENSRKADPKPISHT
jgi:hypothetical protein